MQCKRRYQMMDFLVLYSLQKFSGLPWCSCCCSIAELALSYDDPFTTACYFMLLAGVLFLWGITACRLPLWLVSAGTGKHSVCLYRPVWITDDRYKLVNELIIEGGGAGGRGDPTSSHGIWSSPEHREERILMDRVDIFQYRVGDRYHLRGQ